ncbi:MAG: hypothetical protein ACLFQX_06145 [Candidatus Kapaibacterium sp.]
MIRKFLPFLIAVFLFVIPNAASSQYYFGAGPVYLKPLGDMADINKAPIGVNLQIENRGWCRLWYGLRLDYYSFDPADELDPATDYFESALYISPGIRYNFLGSACRSYNWVPYGQALLNISSIGGTDEESRFGLGASAGAGIAYAFTLFDRCWMIDLNALYSAPNAIARAEDRDMIQSLNVGLTLSIRL